MNLLERRITKLETTVLPRSSTRDVRLLPEPVGGSPEAWQLHQDKAIAAEAEGAFVIVLTALKPHH